MGCCGSKKAASASASSVADPAKKTAGLRARQARRLEARARLCGRCFHFGDPNLIPNRYNKGGLCGGFGFTRYTTWAPFSLSGLLSDAEGMRRRLARVDSCVLTKEPPSKIRRLLKVV